MIATTTEVMEKGKVMGKIGMGMGMENQEDQDGRVIVVDRNIQGRGLDVCVVDREGLNVMKLDRFVNGASSPKRL